LQVWFASNQTKALQLGGPQLQDRPSEPEKVNVRLER
jgi:hypothetical protein